MSDDPLAVALQFGFLAILYLFLLWVARSARRDLVRGQEPALADQTHEHDERTRPPPRRRPRPERRRRAAARGRRGDGLRARHGLRRLGRRDARPGGSADIHVEDPFASSVHARIFARNGFMHVEDMGSTNGTYLNGRQLRKAEQLKPADKIRIGDSEYRYQE